ncbi:MAG: FimV/HubP family polar landmark protein [Salinisphaeraceae bacterium]|nr:FimV/HubP family polar landmark protein [Salinisphaeraceae bacterium]
MRKFVVWLSLSVSLLLAFAGQAFALELGAIQVRSYLNEPLVATIPVRVDNIQQRESLAATLAPETEYVARGLQPLAESDDLIVQVVEGGDIEQMLIELRSLSEVKSPYLGLVLQLSWNGGGQVEEFTVLLDPRPGEMAQEPSPVEAPAVQAAPAEPVGLAPPADEVISEQPIESSAPRAPASDPKLEQLARDMNSAAPAGSEPQMRMSGEPQVIIRKVSPDAYLAGETGSAPSTASMTGADQVIIQRRSPVTTSASKVTASNYNGDTYGPVAAGETLWSIAALVRPSEDVSMQQVMAAIHAANPQAFDGGYNTLKRGATLTIPDQQTMRSASAKPSQTASQRVESSSASNVQQRAVTDEPKAEEKAAAPEDTSIWNTQDTDTEKEAVDPAEREQKGGLVTKSGTSPLAAQDGSTTGDESPAVDASEQAQQQDEATQAGQVDYSALEDASQESQSGDQSASEAGEADSAGSASTEDAPGTDEVAPEAAASEGEADSSADEQPVQAKAEELVEEAAEVAGSGNTLKLAAVILLVILLTYWLFRRRRAQGGGESTTTYVAPIPEDEVDETDYPQAPRDDSQPLGATVATEAADSELGAETVAESDPVLDQVDTYLSYGLYESAADTLEKAIEAEPERSDLRMKLLETHESAGNQDEFVSAVQDWQSSNNPPSEAERSNIEAMGQNLAPGVALFGAAAAAGVAGMAVSEPEDEPSAQADDEVEPAEEELPQPDFDLDSSMDLDMPSGDESGAAPSQDDSEAASVALNLDDSLSAGLDDVADDSSADDELELPDLDLDLGEDKPSAEPSAPAAEDDSLDLNLDDLDFETEETAEPAAAPADEGDLDLSLDESADEPAAVEDTEAAGETDESEFDVKLDLAQAYLEMGEPDLAKGLLDEVVEGGNDTQRSSAQKLLQDID